MNLLLDTHTFLWAVDDSPKLSEEARSAITDGENCVFVSAVTAWEISIKKAIGKLTISYDDYLGEIELHDFIPLDITTQHALAVENLPEHHKDPFDRLLIAQAQVEGFVLVTGDSIFRDYEVEIIET